MRLANDWLRLGGSALTRTSRRVEVAKWIDTGMVSINYPTRLKADLLFGGVKISGYGNELPTSAFRSREQEAHQRRPDRRTGLTQHSTGR